MPSTPHTTPKDAKAGRLNITDLMNIGIFFVINQPVSAGGRQALADDAALAPRFPAAGGPLDAATLRLVRPVQGGL